MGLFPLEDSYALVFEGLAITLALYYLLSFIYKTSKKTCTPPKASGEHPITGHLNLLSGSSGLPHLALASLADRCGPIFTIRLGIRRVLVVSNWEIAKEIFTTHDLIVSNRPKYLAAKILGFNYVSFSFAPYGPYWVGIRKIIATKLMSSSRLQKLQFVRVSELENSMKSIRESWKEKKDEEGKVLVEMKKWFWELNMNIVLRTVAGKQYTGTVDDADAKRISELFREWFHYTGRFVVGDAFPFLGWLDLGGYKKTMELVASRLDSMVSKWLDEHRKKQANDDKKEDMDFMDIMISMTEANSPLEGYGTDTIIKTTCMTLIVSGVDTTSIVLTWALSLLLNNRDTLKKAQEELDMCVGKGRQVNESDLVNLIYLEAVLKEALRLYPAAFLGGPRAFLEDCTVAGYRIPKGTCLLINMWKLHRDPNIWSDPCEFKPERFLTPNQKDVDVIGMDFELIPFGAGRRYCPGTRLALQMLHIVLATLLQNFEMSTPNDAPVDMTASVGMTNAKASPLEVLLSPRVKWS